MENATKYHMDSAGTFNQKIFLTEFYLVFVPGSFLLLLFLFLVCLFFRGSESKRIHLCELGWTEDKKENDGGGGEGTPAFSPRPLPCSFSVST